MIDGASGPAPGPLPWRARLARQATLRVGHVSRRLRLGSGSVIGGRVGLTLDPHLLDALGAGRQVALVSGTNGKTTTTKLLTAALGGRERVATSAAGANLPAGLTAALAGAPVQRIAVLEVDEGYLGRAAEALSPEVVVLLNLSRDQLDRVNEVRKVARRWRQVATVLQGGTVVANADDPLVAWAAQPAPRVVWVAAGQRWRQDSVGCPACEGRLTFAEDGPDWRCACGFERPEPTVVIEAGAVVADGARFPLRLALPGHCNESNAAMAATAASVLGVDVGSALDAMADVRDVEGRFASVAHEGVRARLLLAKNPAGWLELLDMLDDGTRPVVVGINARIADGRDPSWLWDVPFERLAGRLVVATGERCLDLAVRLRHAGVVHRTEPDQLRALHAAGAPEVEYAGNYTAFQDLRRHLARVEGPRRLRPGAHHGAPPEARGPEEAVPAGRGGGARPGASALRVVVVHPDLLGTYGDGGNGLVLARRAEWRGIPVELVLAGSGSPLPAMGDVYCLGGGEDAPQVQAAELLRAGPLAAAADRGAVVLAVCAGYQIIGSSFPAADGRRCRGVGLLDVETVKGPGRRAVGELLAEPLADRAAPGPGGRPWPDDLGLLTGFENHGGVTRVGHDAHALAVVRSGVGNGTGDGTEGAWAGRVVGTYLHGPALARNPALADLLLSVATGETLGPLEDVEERALRAERLHAVHAGAPRRVRRIGMPATGRLVGGRRP
ncbi:MAG TPA: MurT ligase domain-containing protein [Acidimicrobiales bacterium]|nr:MurT ligase domain-containing protein [Acidimicrobiales bacterium]